MFQVLWEITDRNEWINIFSIELNSEVFFPIASISVAFVDDYVGGQNTMDIQVYQEFTQKFSFNI